MGIIEWIAAGLGVGCVFLIIRQSIWCWPVGIAMTSLYAWIFFSVKLYSDFGLQIVYVVLQAYGWWYWLAHADQAQANAKAPIRTIAAVPRLAWLVVGAVSTLGLGFAMATFTDAALPYWDAATTSFSLVAQILLARKVLENWLVWIGVDIVSIGVYLVKGLAVTAGLYGVFLVMAIWGYREWSRTHRLSVSA